jgi:hypothetical protein
VNADHVSDYQLHEFATGYRIGLKTEQSRDNAQWAPAGYTRMWDEAFELGRAYDNMGISPWVQRGRALGHNYARHPLNADMHPVDAIIYLAVLIRPRTRLEIYQAVRNVLPLSAGAVDEWRKGLVERGRIKARHDGRRVVFEPTP